ncbi:DUF6894 family protein [Bradyrhizobium septentrionale]|uniref:DUF6894 domain-containing protein n=1 Tax=Bradyrhizobium septentrionale TaxID=1404411 RepID=A0A973W2B5_9BRAD|nr:hypothetical protein [Bradyrhizobium septentrionale]UGY14969.1 hypothetical protein HAP48_0041640 [Bradyrhizobium septentrionale]UGY23543.1 hypothetical protein HU675_0037230 [Bradyrhizobium septentrionale]
MAFYFFDIQSGREFFADEEGLDLPDQKAAKVEALQTLLGMVKDSVFLDEQPDLAVETRSATERLFCVSLISRKNGAKH